MATVSEVAPQSLPEISAYDLEKRITGEEHATGLQDDLKEHSDDSGEFKQDGVKKVEAITQVWSRKILIATFILLYLVSFVDNLLQSVQSNLTASVTSAFGKHGLLAATSIVASILGGVSKLTIAKIIDIWDRVSGFVFMVFLITLGMIFKATCKSVETYAAAQTLYCVGHLGLLYIIDVVLADMTTLQNRAIITGINSTPTIATTAIRYFGQYKWPSFAGIPFCVLGTALLIHFRTLSSSVGYLVMCQLFNGISSGIWTMTAQLAVMSTVNHQEVAVALALWSMFVSIGAAIGIDIAGALWTSIFPTEL
ncbi:Fc.00g041960.m01.CDS01 [Cosmosporella sp. VM-42]